MSTRLWLLEFDILPKPKAWFMASKKKISSLRGHLITSISPSMSAQRWLSEHHVFNSVFWPKSRFTKYKLNIRSLNISQIEQTVNLTTVKRTIFKLNNGQFNIQHLPIEQIDIYQNCLIWCSIDICSIDICSIDMCPRMGASPQTPWLRGAGAPLRNPPGGACAQ